MATAGFSLDDYKNYGKYENGRFIDNNGYSYDPSNQTWYDQSGKTVWNGLAPSAYAGEAIAGLGGTQLSPDAKAKQQAFAKLPPEAQQAVTHLGASREQGNFLTKSVLPAAALFAGGLLTAPTAAGAAGSAATGGLTTYPLASAPAASPLYGSGVAAGGGAAAGGAASGAFPGAYGAGASGGLSTAPGAVGGSTLPAGLQGIAGPVGGSATGITGGSLLTGLGGSLLKDAAPLLIGGLLGGAAASASSGGGSGEKPGPVSTVRPPPTQFRPNPFLDTPGLGNYSKQAYSLMGNVPPAGAPQAQYPMGTPYGNDAIPVPNQGVPGNASMLPIAPGSGAYRPGADQQRLLPGPVPVNTGPTQMQIPTQQTPSLLPLDEIARRKISGGLNRGSLNTRSLLR